MIHYYLIYKKRRHTTNVRFRDRIGVIIAHRKHRPLQRGSGFGMKKVDWWYRGAPNIKLSV